ncbi:hypothetical protein ELZ95_11500 [Salmonella enterica subsp. enterica serovar Moero]|uniref:Uncharacterized protein n=1 Tax=Salmonella enterica subsp. enterica serovar Moero TaxID=2500154 RepID=A0A3Q9LD04_SALET|nr:hypothetical protein ELZ95_11500 [Salmonella enterica subsp. enterica serovar Moero]AZT03773.1 hypothetical protein ELZ96_11510 [Salmonella enterica subsp. enterica serovar Moero]AZT12114.1 hypothetical protein ELZ75_11510 [Salmonella enterica subsp. enterica serovar Moero]AZT28964.1 hypothetical protein ELZ69_11495 [Salmonella enterica subsp. enterica serovar Moero]
MRKSYFSVSIYLPFEKPLIRRLLYSRILQYTLVFQRVKINSINVVIIFTLLAIYSMSDTDISLDDRI